MTYVVDLTAAIPAKQRGFALLTSVLTGDTIRK